MHSSSGSASGGNSDSDTPEGAQPAQQPAGEQAQEEPAPEEEQRELAQQEEQDDKAGERDQSPGDEEGTPGDGGDGQKQKLPRPVGVAACPRCNSEETKFCYYNNYNVKQPRYFCKASRSPRFVQRGMSFDTLLFGVRGVG